jgi:hypothetical protein
VATARGGGESTTGFLGGAFPRRCLSPSVVSAATSSAATTAAASTASIKPRAALSPKTLAQEASQAFRRPSTRSLGKSEPAPSPFDPIASAVSMWRELVIAGECGARAFLTLAEMMRKDRSRNATLGPRAHSLAGLVIAAPISNFRVHSFRGGSALDFARYRGRFALTYEAPLAFCTCRATHLQFHTSLARFHAAYRPSFCHL